MGRSPQGRGVGWLIYFLLRSAYWGGGVPNDQTLCYSLTGGLWARAGREWWELSEPKSDRVHSHVEWGTIERENPLLSLH